MNVDITAYGIVSLGSLGEIYVDGTDISNGLQREIQRLFKGKGCNVPRFAGMVRIEILETSQPLHGNMYDNMGRQKKSDSFDSLVDKIMGGAI